MLWEEVEPYRPHRKSCAFDNLRGSGLGLVVVHIHANNSMSKLSSVFFYVGVQHTLTGSCNSSLDIERCVNLRMPIPMSSTAPKRCQNLWRTDSVGLLLHRLWWFRPALETSHWHLEALLFLSPVRIHGPTTWNLDLRSTPVGSATTVTRITWWRGHDVLKCFYLDKGGPQFNLRLTKPPPG